MFSYESKINKHLKGFTKAVNGLRDVLGDVEGNIEHNTDSILKLQKDNGELEVLKNNIIKKISKINQIIE